MTKNKRLTIIIISVYGILAGLLAASIVYSYIMIGEKDTIFKDAEPWIKLIVAGFPQMLIIAKLTLIAAFGVMKVNSADNGQRMVMQQMKGVKR